MKKSEKLFFIFVMIVLTPSIIFAYKTYKSIGDKKDALLLKERLQVNNILSHISEKTIEELLKREKIEAKRPYYEYSYYFTPEGVVSKDYVIQKSPLSELPEDKLIVGYFQIDDAKRLTSPFFFEDKSENDKADISDREHKEQFLMLINSKVYPALVKELLNVDANPFKEVNQNPLVQLSYENIKDIYEIVNADASKKPRPNKKFNFANLTGANKSSGNRERPLDLVKYYPIQYLYKNGGLFAFRKALVQKRLYIQGYMIDIVYLVDNILRKFISSATLDNFSISPYPIEGKTPYASTSLSDNLNFIKLYVYKNDNSYIDSMMREEFLKYYASAAVLFAIILVGCAFIYRTIRSEAEINQKKGDFISAVTHELKTPLTSIRLYSEMLLEDMVKDEKKKKVYYDYMLKESERLTRLINNVLDFSKIENNKKVFNIQNGNLKELIVELCAKYENNLKVAGFEFSYEINDVGQIPFDGDAITQVFINLLDNAVKYSAASNQKKIEIKLHESSSGKATLEIADKGIGIPKSQQKKIFEKFYRIENELTRVSKGSGIGLSIVKEYAKAHHGNVEVISKEKEGAKFRITLPKMA